MGITYKLGGGEILGVTRGNYATTMIESLGNKGFGRENGVMVSKSTGYSGKWIDFGLFKQFAMTIPWGDISTAYTTTGIPNIETYAGASKIAFYLMKLQFLFNPMNCFHSTG